MLLMMEKISLLIQRIKLAARFVVGPKLIDPAANVLGLRLGQKGFATFLRLLDDSAGFGSGLHVD